MALKYLGLADVCYLHEEVMKRLGVHPQPLTNHGACMSALDRPRTAAHYENADLVRQAACLGMGIARAHAFVDGNKRTAQQCLLVFLSINGCRIVGGKKANLALAKLMENLLEPTVIDADADNRLEDWLRAHTNQC